MTGLQILDAFDVYYDKIANLAAAGYLESEKLLFLNNAQDDFVKERVFGKNFQPPAFDENEKRVADIRPLVTRRTWNTIVNTVYGNSVYVDPYNYDTLFLYPLKVDIRITRTNPVISSQYVPCKSISLKETGNFMINGTYNRTWFKYPVYMTARDTGLFVIGDYYTTVMDSVRVNYVRRPYPITSTIGDFNSTLNASFMSLEPHIHQEIVEMAAKAAAGVQGDPRYQVQTIEQQTKTT